MPRKLVIAPDQDGYSVTPGSEFISVGLAGGKSRQRRDIVGAASRVSVQWPTDQSGYNYLAAFFRIYQATPGEGFLIDLYMGESRLTEHTAYFVADSFSLDGQEGNGFDVSATLEVMPRTYSADDDNALPDFYESYPNDGDALLGALATLVNVTTPGNLR